MAEPNTLSISSAGSLMQSRPTGPHATVWKYDLLTALSLYALGQGGTVQTSILRLIVAITARYDWRRDELSIGRAELMRLWQCSEPTVKRELRRYRASGLLIQIRAGVRGRVAAYQLGRQAVNTLTSASWCHAGSDFRNRMSNGSTCAPEAADEAGNVVSFPVPEEVKDHPPNMPLWASFIATANPVIYRNWFGRVIAEKVGDTVVFRAPSSFIASQIETRFQRYIREATQYAWPGVAHVRIEHG